MEMITIDGVGGRRSDGSNLLRSDLIWWWWLRLIWFDGDDYDRQRWIQFVPCGAENIVVMDNDKSEVIW